MKLEKIAYKIVVEIEKGDRQSLSPFLFLIIKVLIINGVILTFGVLS